MTFPLIYRFKRENSNYIPVSISIILLIAISDNNNKGLIMTILILPFTFTLFHRFLRTYLELHCVYEAPALVTLIPASFWVAAERTDAFHEAVSQKALTLLTTQLLHHVFQQEPVLVESPEYILSNPSKKKRKRWLKTASGAVPMMQFLSFARC